MTEPEKTFERLLELPPEIWGSITFYIPGEQLSRLKITGSRYLWNKLCVNRALWSIFLGRNGIPFKRWPAFLNDLPNVEELCIYDRIEPWLHEFQLSMLPKSLRQLKYLSLNSLISLVNGINMESHFSNLEKLQLNISWIDKNNWITKYKGETLSSLEISFWDCSIPLPANLTNLNIDNVSPRFGNSNLEFPRALEILKIGINENIDLLWPLLPPTLLSLSANKRGNADEAKMSQYPASLTKLTLTNLFSNTSPSPLVKLTKLSVIYLPTIFWPHLPETLKKLKIRGVLRQPGLAPSTDAEPSNTEMIPIWSLPRSITKLWIYFEQLRSIDCPVASISIERLSSASCSIPCLFPPFLQDLTLKNALLTVESATLLPPSLTSLSLSDLSQSVCEKLPRNLMRLKSEKAVLSPQFINSLPRSLTSLNLTNNDGLSGSIQNIYQLWNFNQISQQDNEAKLNWDDYRFPTALRSLKISRLRYLDDSVMNHPLQHLEILSLRSSVSVTDSLAHKLPRHLTTLELELAGKITGKCFPWLPRHLKLLNLNRAMQVYDSDVQHLPNSLSSLHLDSAIHLTNSCVKYLPRSLTYIHMLANSRISIDSLHDMPFSVRCALNTAKSTFINSSWAIYSGIASLNEIEEED